MTEQKRASSRVDLPPSAVFAEIDSQTVPWHFGTIEGDYWNLRRGSGLIDLTGAGLLRVSGSGAQDLLDAAITREVGYMTQDRTIMGLMLAEDGRPIDLVVLYRSDEAFLVQTSVGRSDLVLDVLRERAEDGTSVDDASSDLVLLGIEGPKATEVVSNILIEPVDGLPFQGARTTSWSGGDALVTRTGVTGEFGFIVMVPADDVQTLWDTVAKSAPPTGFAALETAMLEVRQPILGRELLDDDTVETAGLNWLVDIQKEAFIGRDALLQQFDAGPPTRRVSFTAAGDVSRGDAIRLDGETVGDVVHAAYSPSLERHCGIGRVDPAFAASGLVIEIGSCEGRTVSSPMLTPTSWLSLRT